MLIVIVLMDIMIIVIFTEFGMSFRGMLIVIMLIDNMPIFILLNADCQYVQFHYDDSLC